MTDTAAAPPLPPTGTPPASDTADEGPERRDRSGTATGDRHTTQDVFNAYFQTFDTDNVFFGDGPPSGDRRRSQTKRSGTLSAEYVDEVLANYVASEAEPECQAKLRKRRCVILVGARGTGRHCGAMHLLRALAPDKRIVLLPPGLTTTELSKRDYAAPYAYIAPDVEICDDGEQDTDAALLSNALVEAGTFLVTTQTPAHDTPRAHATHSLTAEWMAPHLSDLAAEYIHDEQRRKEALALILRDGDDVHYAVRTLCAALKSIDDGVGIDQAIGELLRADLNEVHEWFNEDPDPTLILDLFVVSFLGPLTRPDFERCRETLGRALNSSGTTASKDTDQPVLAQQRYDRGQQHRLLRFTRPAGAGNEIVVDFDKPGHRHAVIIELYARYDFAVWRAVQGWIETTLTTARHPHRAAFAVGRALGMLAGESVDEVCERFLTPWSETDPAGALQASAVYTIWAMCGSENTTTAALTFCRNLLFQGVASQVWTASMGFAGEVGRAFPAESTRRLWQLFVSDKPARIYAAEALPQLFLVLELDGSSSVQVLRQLHDAVKAHNKPGLDQPLRRRVLAETVDVLGARRNTNEPPASFNLFDRSPDARTVLGELWIAVLLNRRFRGDAIASLVAGLRLLDEQDAAQATAFAAMLGEAIFPLLPDSSVAAISAEFRTVARRRAANKTDSDAVQDLINILSRDRSQENRDDGTS